MYTVIVSSSLTYLIQSNISTVGPLTGQAFFDLLALVLLLLFVILNTHYNSVVNKKEKARKLNQKKLVNKLKKISEELDEKTQELDENLLEMAKIQGHLLQSEKMAILGQMLSGISHEINNPVNFIHGNVPYVEEYLMDLVKVLQVYQENCPPTNPKIKEVLAEVDIDYILKDLPEILSSIQLGTDRIRDLVINLKKFYRLDELTMRPANLHEALDTTLILLQNRYKKKIDIIKNYQPIPLVECHINQINQVFMNIINNAIDALLDEKSINFEPFATKQIKITTEAGDNDRVKIIISDNGSGISPEAQKHLFEPFFTTKPIGVGTGLGLSICYKIIHQNHQGNIYCCSDVKQGTTFVIDLPIRQESEQQ
jgi:two-component system NtrC family sensor kinase